jgi:segregation and condensation protein A
MNGPTFYLENIIRDKDDLQDFEGPLNLILILLSKNKVEINDIQVADILDQYLAFINQMQRMDLEVASEFVQMASYLLYIKTKSLLVKEEENTELELLKQSLMQLKARDVMESVRQILPELAQRSKTGLLYITKSPEILHREKEKEIVYSVSQADLFQALFRLALRSQNKTEDLSLLEAGTPKSIPYGVQEKSREILGSMHLGKRYALSGFYRECRSRSEIVATFISILELCARGAMTLSGEGKQIYITRNEVSIPQDESEFTEDN